AAQWHPTANGEFTPEMVTAGSARKYWWKCPKGPDHEWQAQVNARTKLSTGCPCCAGQKVSVTNSLATLFPEIAAQWHPTANGNLIPEMVAAGSTIKAWWKCPKGSDHIWQAMVCLRTQQGSGCHFCWGREVSDSNSLAFRFPNIAAEWHTTRNG